MKWLQEPVSNLNSYDSVQARVACGMHICWNRRKDKHPCGIRLCIKRACWVNN